MGQGFSNSISVSEFPDSPKSMMLMAICNGKLEPLPASKFFRNPRNYSESSVILIEPQAQKTYKKEEFPHPKVSYKEVIRVVNQIYKITPSMISDFKIWILSPTNITSKDRSQLMQLIKNTKFEFFTTNADIMPESIFIESALPASINDAIKRPVSSPRKNDSLALPSRGNSLTISFENSAFTNPGPLSSPKSEERIYKDSCDKIVDGLYISGEKVASDLPLLLKTGITHIVNVNAGASPINFPDHFKYCSVHLTDSVFEVFNDEFWDAVKFTDEAIANGGKILVHCRKGISRSAALCLAYLLEYRGVSYDEGMNLLRKARPMVDINNGFAQQILNHSKGQTNSPSDINLSLTFPPRRY